MPDTNQLDTLMTEIQSLRSRLRVLETTMRVGLNRIVSSHQTAAVDPSAYGVYESGAVGNTWTSSDGTSGTGYPLVTVPETGTRILFIATVRPTGICSLATYRTNALTTGVGIDGATPAFPTYRQIADNGTAPHDAPITWSNVVTLTPGAHTFRLWASFNDNNPLGANLPRYTDASLIILPLTAS